ncbi:GNAT family N-acetyltransferase [Aestuariibacter halophilus]|uniref:GNAT family N-acetyltransferase n=1 Tax=Fluctibacter halophilus TaxID=226011 RepID=A0ABS8G8E8_9ALTE|nr:GNAT family N-acetyltransferase [Aestuariibacter halophilus]MCC2616436.1 GNAT family N-acetyltransferase [Aestuariibacter halophilus]
MHIRHSTEQDIPAIHQLYAQPSCYAQTLQTPFPSLIKWQRMLSQPGDDFRSLVAISDNGQLAGQLGMALMDNPRRRHVANIGMAVDESQRRQGVADKLLLAAMDLAMNWLAIRRLELEVYCDNDAAIALYQKHGFVIEGTAREYAFRDGQYTDVHLMAKCITGA